MATKIPAGYQIQITSWENDADHYNTVIKSGLTKDTAKFLLRFAELFKSANNHQDPGFGNQCRDHDETDWDALTAKFSILVLKYPSALKELGWSKTDLAKNASGRDVIHELHYDLFGGSEYFSFRVFDTAESYYYPEAVKSVKL